MTEELVAKQHSRRRSAAEHAVRLVSKNPQQAREHADLKGFATRALIAEQTASRLVKDGRGPLGVRISRNCRLVPVRDIDERIAACGVRQYRDGGAR